MSRTLNVSRLQGVSDPHASARQGADMTTTRPPTRSPAQQTGRRSPTKRMAAAPSWSRRGAFNDRNAGRELAQAIAAHGFTGVPTTAAAGASGDTSPTPSSGDRGPHRRHQRSQWRRGRRPACPRPRLLRRSARSGGNRRRRPLATASVLEPPYKVEEPRRGRSATSRRSKSSRPTATVKGSSATSTPVPSASPRRCSTGCGHADVGTLLA